MSFKKNKTKKPSQNKHANHKNNFHIVFVGGCVNNNLTNWGTSGRFVIVTQKKDIRRQREKGKVKNIGLRVRTLNGMMKGNGG